MHERRDLVVGQLLGQELGDDRGLGALLVGQLGAIGVVEACGGLASLLGLASASTPMTSSSVSSRACLPATSAFVIAVSTIRSVEERSSSRAFMEVVRSCAELVLERAMPAIVAACDRL